MRIRTIKPEFFTHEGLFELESETGLPIRIAFAGLWCAADREGRFKWEPRRLGVQILPYDQIDFSRVLDALTTRGFTRRYRVDGKDFGVIPSFLCHQVINNREKPSELPKPLDFMEFDACRTRDSRVDDASKAERKGKEEERNGIPPNPQGGLALEIEDSKPSDPMPKGWQKMNAKTQGQTRVNFNTIEMVEFGKIMGRGEKTLWTVAEAMALMAVKPTPDEIELAKKYYHAQIDKPDDWRRRNIITLLNNWNGEVDRARIFTATNK